MTPRFTRRRLFQTAAASGLLWSAPRCRASAPFPVQFRKASPWDALRPQIEPGHDEFAVEKEAADVTARWNRLFEDRSAPLAADFRGASPMPARYKTIAHGVFEAEFDGAQKDFQAGLESWMAKLGRIRSARFFVLPRGRVRYEIASTSDSLLNYRVGLWRQAWRDGKLSEFEPLEETLVTSPAPLFRDVTAELFGQSETYQKQLLRGTPYWRARLDSASGIDVYGNNGIAVGDVDGDGRDEVYVCQPAGLPNRLYKLSGAGVIEDVTERWGIGLLDDSTAALFLDLRNSGRQDLVVLTTGGPLLFLNDGTTLRHKPGAFRFQTSPQGTFTGMAAADYDRDGRIDLYLCLLRLLPERGPIPLSRSLPRRAKRPAEFHVPQSAHGRWRRPLRRCDSYRAGSTRTIIAIASRPPGATTMATAGPTSTSPTISAGRICTRTIKAATFKRCCRRGWR